MSRCDHPIGLLHLSDLHFRAGRAWDSDPVLRGLAAAMGRGIEADGLAPDLVVITGDLGFSGQADEYALVRDWLERRLWSRLPVGFPRRQLLVVPGTMTWTAPG